MRGIMERTIRAELLIVYGIAAGGPVIAVAASHGPRDRAHQPYLEAAQQ